MKVLDYPSFGLAIFACHYPVANGVARCSCGNTDCASPAKHPYGRLAPHGLKDASKDPRFIERWCAGPYNIAVATGSISGVIVLDIDPRNGGDESLAELEAEHGALPLTWRVLTGGGGEHIYFAHPGGHIEKPDFAAGINLKGDGGYVIAPPSRHIAGRPYAWHVDGHPENVSLAPTPKWVILRAQASERRAAGQIDWRAFASEAFLDGSRHNALTRLAGLLFYRLSREPHLAAQLLISFNQTRYNPPIPDDELVKIIDWAASRELYRRRPAT